MYNCLISVSTGIIQRYRNFCNLQNLKEAFKEQVMKKQQQQTTKIPRHRTLQVWFWFVRVFQITWFVRFKWPKLPWYGKGSISQTVKIGLITDMEYQYQYANLNSHVKMKLNSVKDCKNETKIIKLFRRNVYTKHFLKIFA